jgi:uncharacterized protein YyaL (SSP411 family)
VDGTSTCNVAWAALALLTLHQATKQQSFLVDARHLIDWVIANVSSGSGFRGGFHGYDPQQVPLTWISTEHNVDVYVKAGRRLAMAFAATWLRPTALASIRAPRLACCGVKPLHIPNGGR